MIVHAKAAFDLFESIGPAPAFADCDQFSLCENEIFKIVDVPEEGFPSVISLRSPRGFRKAIKSLFDISREPDGKHENLRYTSIARSGIRGREPYLSRAPTSTSSAKVARTALPSAVVAATTMPFDSRPRSLRGARLATSTILRPMSDSGA